MRNFSNAAASLPLFYFSRNANLRIGAGFLDIPEAGFTCHFFLFHSVRMILSFRLRRRAVFAVPERRNLS